MRSAVVVRWIFLIVAVVATQSLLSQSALISGRVIDAITNAPLVGATVTNIESGDGTITDVDGNFTLEDLEPGVVDIEIRYIGYAIREMSLTISQEALRDLVIMLDPSATVLSEIEVTGIMEGTIRAMAEQKNAENIKNVLSAEQIASFPDVNAAEAMQRIPGITLQRDQGEGRYVQLRGTPPELTNFNVNGEQVPSPEGNVRYVGMDVISSDQIEFIEVTKVLTPDMDADGIGGSVNIRTKQAQGEDPSIRGAVSLGYNNLRKAPVYQAQFAYGQRYGKFGFNINSSYYRNNQAAHNLEYKYAKGPFFGSQDSMRDNYFVQYREVQLRHYEITRTRIGVSPTLDYKFNKNSRIYINGMFNSFTDDETRRRKIYDLDDALSFDYYLYGGIDHDVKKRRKQQLLSTIGMGGEHLIGRVKLDYQVFFATASEKQPDRLEARFENPGQAIAISFDRSDPDFPVAIFPNPENAENATDYENYEMDELLLEEIDITDRNITPRINIEVPVSFSKSSTGYVKIGGKMRLKRKERDVTSQSFAAYFEESNIYPDVGPPLSLVTVHDGWREDNLLNQGYVLEYMPDADLMRDFYEFYPHHFIFDRTATRTNTFGEDYEANENIYAAYAMFRQDFNRLMVLGGLRYEQTNIDYTGAKILTDRGRFVGIDTLKDKRTHKFWLPQVQLKYALNDNINLRAALTYSYSRPNFEDVLPYREQDREEVKYGNPDLKYPQATNVDFLIERYYKRSIFSGGLFYKRIDDFIFFFKRFAHEGDPKDYSLVEITKAINGKKASVYGAELQAQFKFHFLDGFWQNFGLYANYTFTYSEAFINQRLPANYTDAIVVFGEDDLTLFYDDSETEKISLPGQAKHTSNVAIFYDSPKFFGRITANFQDDFLYQLGADADLDEYYDKAFRLDLTVNYKVNNYLSVFADAVNLTNTPLRFYLGSEEYVQQQEYYSWWAKAGVRVVFN